MTKTDRIDREIVFRNGLQAYRLGRFDDALAHFREVVDQGSTEPRHLSYLGLTLATQLRSRTGAEELCERAALLAPDDPQMQINLARVHEATGSKIRAAEILRRALEDDRENAAVLNELDRMFPRQADPVPFLPRAHFVNRFLGRRRNKTRP